MVDCDDRVKLDPMYFAWVYTLLRLPFTPLGKKPPEVVPMAAAVTDVVLPLSLIHI